LEVLRGIEETGGRALAFGLDLLHGRHARLEVRVVLPPCLARVLPRQVHHAVEVARYRLLRSRPRADLDALGTGYLLERPIETRLTASAVELLITPRRAHGVPRARVNLGSASRGRGEPRERHEAGKHGTANGDGANASIPARSGSCGEGFCPRPRPAAS